MAAKMASRMALGLTGRAPKTDTPVEPEEVKVTGALDPNFKWDYHYTWWRVKTKIRNMDAGDQTLEPDQDAPHCRSGHACFMLGASDTKVFIHGGAAGGRYYNDLWVLETRTKKWEKLHTYKAPKPRAYHQIVVVAPDPSMIGEGSRAVPRMVLFGGFMEGQLFTDVHVMDQFSVITKGLPKASFGRIKKKTDEPPSADHVMDVWHKIPVSGEPPMPRCNHTMSVIGGKMIVMIGGWHGAFTNDVYTLDTETWVWTLRKTKKHESVKTGDEFLPRAGHTATPLPGRKILVFGGQNAKQGQLGDLWILDTVLWEWRRATPIGSGPSKRSGHAAAFNRAGIVYFCGGWDGVRMRADLSVLHVSGDPDTHWKWKVPTVRGANIPPRVSTSLSIVGNFLNDTYALEVTATKRDTEKDAAMRAKIKLGIKRMGAAAEMAAFERAKDRGVDPLAMMDPKKMTLDQLAEYHENIDTKLDQAAEFLRAKDQEIHFLQDRQLKVAKREKALQTAHAHQMHFKGFLEMGATTEEAVALAGGFATPELQARFGAGGYSENPPAPGGRRRQDMSKEEVEQRIHGRGFFPTRTGGHSGADDILDAIAREGGLAVTWGDGSLNLPDDMWGTESEDSRDVALMGGQSRWEIADPYGFGGEALSQASSQAVQPIVPLGHYLEQEGDSALGEFMGSSGMEHSIVPVYTGELPLVRNGDETLGNISDDMGPVLREVLRDQAKMTHLRKSHLKVPPPARHATRPTRIAAGVTVPECLDDIIDPTRVLDDPNKMLIPAPYNPASIRVAQDLDDVAVQASGSKTRGAVDDGLAIIARQTAEMSLGETSDLPHSLLILAAAQGVEPDRAIRAARGEPLPIPGVAYGEDPNKPIPEGIQKVVNGMQRVAKGWMQKRDYRREMAARRIQALVRGRQERKQIDSLRRAEGLPPLRSKYVRKALASKCRYEVKRQKDVREAYDRRLAGITPAIYGLPQARGIDVHDLGAPRHWVRTRDRPDG